MDKLLDVDGEGEPCGPGEELLLDEDSSPFRAAEPDNFNGEMSSFACVIGLLVGDWKLLRCSLLLELLLDPLLQLPPIMP